MGKDLRGKEIGEGVRQRKDGKYVARFRSKSGNRPERTFNKLADAKRWLTDSKYEEEHNSVFAGSNMTVDTWFNYWITNIKANHVKESTLNTYISNYKNWIKGVIGNMLLKDVKPIHCQEVLNRKEGCAKGTSQVIKNLMHDMFSSAEENEFMLKCPVTRMVKTSGTPPKDKYVLKVEEEEILLKALKKTKGYNIFALTLQTGMRVGEITGLKWSDVDFNQKTITVNRTIKYSKKEQRYIETSPKTQNGYRSIPLTDKAIEILLNQKKKRRPPKKTIPLAYYDYIFLTTEGMPVAISHLDDVLDKYCKRLNIPHISMHNLRHTFATRCIEAGMRPKTVQTILGHKDITLTMNLYVHTDQKELAKELIKFERYA